MGKHVGDRAVIQATGRAGMLYTLRLILLVPAVISDAAAITRGWPYHDMRPWRCLSADSLEYRKYYNINRLLYIEVTDIERVCLDKFAARFYVIPHQRGKYIVCGDGIFDANLE